jgi:hypothetical protein
MNRGTKLSRKLNRIAKRWQRRIAEIRGDEDIPELDHDIAVVSKPWTGAGCLFNLASFCDLAKRHCKAAHCVAMVLLQSFMGSSQLIVLSDRLVFVRRCASRLHLIVLPDRRSLGYCQETLVSINEMLMPCNRVQMLLNHALLSEKRELDVAQQRRLLLLPWQRLAPHLEFLLPDDAIR